MWSDYDEDSDKECNSWSDSPVHGLLMGSGKKVVIHIYYDDWNYWSLSPNFTPVSDVTDLTFVFETTNEKGPKGLTRFTIESNGMEFQSNSFQYASVRFRPGAALAWILDESAVICEARAQWKEGSVQDVTFEREEAVAHNRGLITDDGPVTVPAEVIALHSPYFMALFFGNFKEKKMKWIRLKGATKMTVHHLMCTILHPSTPDSYWGLGVHVSLIQSAVEYFHELNVFCLYKQFDELIPSLIERCQILMSRDRTQYEVISQVAELVSFCKGVDDFLRLTREYLPEEYQ